MTQEPAARATSVLQKRLAAADLLQADDFSMPREPSAPPGAAEIAELILR